MQLTIDQLCVDKSRNLEFMTDVHTDLFSDILFITIMSEELWLNIKWIILNNEKWLVIEYKETVSSRNGEGMLMRSNVTSWLHVCLSNVWKLEWKLTNLEVRFIYKHAILVNRSHLLIYNDHIRFYCEIYCM